MNDSKVIGTASTSRCLPIVCRSAIASAPFGRRLGALLTALLPHEWLCTAFCASLLLNLISAVGLFTRDSVFLAALLGAEGLMLIFFHRTADSGRRWRVRLGFFAIAMNLLYPVLKTAIPAVHAQLEDARLQAVDRRLIGSDLGVRLQHFICPSLTSFLSFCYMFYFGYLLFTEAWYLAQDLGVLKRFYMGLFSIYAIGYFGYLWVPALGPYLAMANQFHVTLAGGWLTTTNAKLVLYGSNRVDVFPSLHCGNSLYILLSDYQHTRRRFWICLLPCIGLWLATIYLRYHYFIDVVCGFVIGWLAWKLANRKAVLDDTAAAEAF